MFRLRYQGTLNEYVDKLTWDIVQDELFDTLCVPYTSINAIKLLRPSTSEKGDCDCIVTISVNSPPLLGKEPVQPASVTDSATELSVAFSLGQSDFSRFSVALESRGLVSITRFPAYD